MAEFVVDFGKDECLVPAKTGVYVAYTAPLAAGLPCERQLLLWCEGQWTYMHSDQRYRGHVYGFIGPIPVLRPSS